MDDMTTTDIEATEEGAASKGKRSSARFYETTDGWFMVRENGVDTRVISMGDARLPTHELTFEGMRKLYIAGKTLDEILSRTAFSDRSPPAEKVAKGGQRGRVSMQTHAIAAAAAIEMTKKAKENGDKISKDQINAKALAWALNQSSEEKARLGKKRSVLIELAKLRGEEGSLDVVINGNKEEDDAA